MTYRIRDWGGLYETPETRKLKHMRWVPVRNDMDDIGYVRLIDHPDGAAHFGVWVAILEIASKGNPRGTLICRDSSMTCEDISRISRIPSGLIEDAVARLVGLKWLDVEDNENTGTCVKSAGILAESPEIPAESAGTLAESAGRIEGNRREGKGIEGKAVVVVAPCGKVENSELQTKQPTDSKPLYDWEKGELETQWIREALLDFTAKIPGWTLPPPDDALCQRVLALVGKQHSAIIGQVLKELFRAGKRPAESWGWFPAVIEEYLKPRAVAR